MKKQILFILFAVAVKFSFSQTDQISAIKAIGETVVYTEYYSVEAIPGKNVISGKNYTVTLKPVLNRFGKVVGYNGFDTEAADKAIIRYDNLHWDADHYTHPSYYKNNYNVFTIINGVIFQLENFKSITSFGINGMWIPKVPKDRIADPIFKGSSMKDLKSADLIKLVQDYFAAMKTVQAANPYSAANQEEADVMQFIIDSTYISYNQKNANYWNSEEGKKKLGEMRQKKVTLVNDTNADLLLCYGSGAYSTLKPGEKQSFSCTSGKVFKGTPRANNTTQHDATTKVLLNLDGTGCGNVINASTVIK